MIGNFVQQTANNPGTAATVTLAGPSAGRRGIIAAFGGGATVYLGMEDGTQWQLVEALTVAGPPQQITITTVISNSAGTTARLNFTGSVRIYSVLPAERNIYHRADGSVPLTGDTTISKAQPQLVLNKSAPGQSAWLTGRTNGSTRWQLRLGNDEAEAGGNAGSNFDVLRYSDAGAFLDAPLAISRVTGGVNFSQRPTHAGNPIMPAGLIGYFVGTAAPAGWVKANGTLLSRTTFADLFAHANGTGLVSEADWTNNNFGRYSVGDGSTTFRVPDLRGEFVRSWDDARGVDSGRAIGTWQGDELRSHTHTIAAPAGSGIAAGGTSSLSGAGTQNITSSAAGGAETRPRNLALLACIKF